MQADLKFNLKVLLGCTCVLGSALFFYLSSVVIKLAQIRGLQINPAAFVFARFLLGFISVVTLLVLKKKKLKIRKKHYLIGRTVFNCLAAYCFFKGVQVTSVAQANILNMTYPLFITLFSWVLFKEQRDIITIFIVILAFCGVWMILSPEKMSFHLNSLWALVSGISAAIGIIYLNLSRQVHDTETTLFFLFGAGSVIIFILFFNQMKVPGFLELKYLLLCSFFAIAGQYSITLGFKHVTALEGGVLSSMRILLAAVLGPFIAMDPALSVYGWTGAFLIFSGNVYLTVRATRL